MVRRLKTRQQSSDPFRLAQELGILLLFTPMGDFDAACKGFFLLQSRTKSITVNSCLSPALQRVVAAHELGHALLHAKDAKLSAFQDFSIFGAGNENEFEANIFAAELLISDEEVLEALKTDTLFFALAQRLDLPAEMLDFKLKSMQKRGYALQSPIYSDAKCLLKIKNSEK